MIFTFSTLSVALASLSLVSAFPHDGHGLAKKSHHGAVAHSHAKRYGGQATYYAVGLGACGDWNVPSDYIVALNSAQLDSSRYPPVQCGRKIRISHNGKSAVATIKDECPTCGYGDLDLSESLFKHFEPTSKGIFQMNWEYISGDGGDDGDDDDDKKTTTRKTTTTKKTTTTTTHHRTTTTTTTHRPTTTTTEPETTTTTTKKSSSSTTESSTSESSTSATSSSASSSSSTSAATTTSAGGATTQSGGDGDSSVANVEQLVALLANMASVGRSS